MILNYFQSRFIFPLLLICSLTDLKGQTDSSFVMDTVKNIIIFTTTVDLLDNELQSQDISGLLQSSRDVYVNQADLILVQLDID